MPILNKFRIRTPIEEFENYLGEEMNAFSGFFMEESKNNETEKATEAPNNKTVKQAPVSQSFWLRIKTFFKKVS